MRAGGLKTDMALPVAAWPVQGLLRLEIAVEALQPTCSRQPGGGGSGIARGGCHATACHSHAAAGPRMPGLPSAHALRPRGSAGCVGRPWPQALPARAHPRSACTKAARSGTARSPATFSHYPTAAARLLVLLLVQLPQHQRYHPGAARAGQGRCQVGPLVRRRHHQDGRMQDCNACAYARVRTRAHQL